MVVYDGFTSAPSDDTLHLDRPEQLAGFQIAHASPRPSPAFYTSYRS